MTDNESATLFFSFILAIMEVNAFLAMIYFGGWKGIKLEFGNKLACYLVHNTLDVDGAITRTLNTEKFQ